MSADARALQLNELISSDDPDPGAAGPSSASLAGIAAHHVKAWKFEDNNGSYKDVPVQLADGQGRLTMDLQTTASYLILHVHAAGSPLQELGTAAQKAALGGIAEHASATCTPRGLINKVSHGSAGESSARIDYSLFVWHGMGVEPLVKAHAFVKAFELDRQLRAGLLWQRGFLDGMRQAVKLTSCAAVASPGRAQSASQVSDVDQFTNRLISMIAKGGRQNASRPTPTPARRPMSWSWRRAPSPGAASPRGRSYPMLSLSVWRSLGVVVPKRTPKLQLDGLRELQGGARRSPLSSPRQHSPRRATSPRQQSSPRGAASAQARVEVPRLALGSMQGQPDNPSQCSPELPPRPSPSMGTAQLTCNQGDMDLVTSARSALSSARFGSRTGSRSPPRMMSPRGLGPRVSPQEPDAVAKLPALNLSMMNALSRLDDSAEAKRHMLRPSELKQMEIQKYHDVCSEVVPKQIYISSYKVASDLSVLERNEITHILNLAADNCDDRFPDKFTYATYYVKDTSSEDISMLFYTTLEWMQATIHSGGRVLVHCREGVSRSATMVIAYLMWANNLPFKEAQEVIRKVRPICNPNPGFTYHLLELGKRLGTGTPRKPGTGSQTIVFRVRPHHPQKPFLLLEPQPSQKPQSLPVFDPRFGWVVRTDKQLVLWLGSQIPDAEAVQATVLQHAQYYETFEKIKYNVTIMQEGEETPLLWQTLGLPPVQKGKPGPALAAVRPNFDQDYEIARRAAAL